MAEREKGENPPKQCLRWLLPLVGTGSVALGRGSYDAVAVVDASNRVAIVEVLPTEVVVDGAGNEEDGMQSPAGNGSHDHWVDPGWWVSLYGEVAGQRLRVTYYPADRRPCIVLDAD